MNKGPETLSSSELADFFKMPVGIHWVKPNGSIIKSTVYEMNTLGYTPKELTKMDIQELFIDKEEINDILQKIKVGGVLQDYQTQLKCKNDTIRYVLINTYIHREDNKHIHTRFFLRDISEKRRGELSNAFLSAIIEDSDDAIYSRDLDGTITSWNESAERMFGYTANEVIGETVSITPEEHIRELKENISKIRQGKRINHYETVRERKDGRRLNVSLNMSPIKDAQGNIIGVSKVARDITERKQAEAKLLSYQKQLKSLVSRLNKIEEQERKQLAAELHDNLGQLLTLSKMKLDQFEKKSRPESQSSEIKELRSLINEAIDYTRELMSNLSPPPTLAGDHFETAIAWVVNKMENHDLKIDIENNAEVISLEDEVQTVLLRSLRELLLNVVKHAKVNKAKIVISQKGTQVRIKITDGGVGFDLNTKDLASSDGKRFGLFNINERMQLLGGKLVIHSEPGKGTTAELIAPLK